VDCQLFPISLKEKFKVMKREAYGFTDDRYFCFVCWPCTMPVSRHSCEEPSSYYQFINYILIAIAEEEQRLSHVSCFIALAAFTPQRYIFFSINDKI
jgi:hypothetical protein